VSALLERYRATQAGTVERREVEAKIAAEVAGSGAPTVEAMRAALRRALADCPACCEDDEAGIPDGEVVAWLLSHGVDPGEMR